MTALHPPQTVSTLTNEMGSGSMLKTGHCLKCLTCFYQSTKAIIFLPLVLTALCLRWWWASPLELRKKKILSLALSLSPLPSPWSRLSSSWLSGAVGWVGSDGNAQLLCCSELPVVGCIDTRQRVTGETSTSDDGLLPSAPALIPSVAHQWGGGGGGGGWRGPVGLKWHSCILWVKKAFYELIR